MKKYALILTALLIAVACNEKPEWQPGDPDPKDCIGFYFDADNSSYHLIDPENASQVTILVHREVCEEAVDIPLNVSCDVPGLKFPSTVHFDKGSADSSFDIDYSALEMKVMASYRIEVPREYLNIYSDSHYNSFSGSILVSKWTSAMKDESNVKFTVCESNYVLTGQEPKAILYTPYESRMEILPGANLYRIHDFMGSGVTISFSLLKSPFPNFKKFYRIVPEEGIWTYDEYEPEDGSEFDADAYYHGWGLYVEEPDDWDEAANGEFNSYPDHYLKDLDGKDTFFTGFNVWSHYDGGTAEYSYASGAGAIDADGKEHPRCEAGLYVSFQTEIGATKNVYIYFEWDLMAN